MLRPYRAPSTLDYKKKLTFVSLAGMSKQHLIFRVTLSVSECKIFTKRFRRCRYIVYDDCSRRRIRMLGRECSEFRPFPPPLVSFLSFAAKANVSFLTADCLIKTRGSNCCVCKIAGLSSSFIFQASATAGKTFPSRKEKKKFAFLKNVFYFSLFQVVTF